jgi:hypothetical protein
MSDQNDLPSEEEARELENHLRKLADQWREKLADPQVQAQIKAGTMVVSPLVEQLLSAFPPAQRK